MAGYFSYLPNIRYLSRSLDRRSIQETNDVKNIFRRVKVREDQASVVYAFDDFYIPGDTRPDQLAETYYGDSRYDWVILVANNIIDIRNEWPMDDLTFRKYLIEKYGSEEKIGEIHHYETSEQLDDYSRIVIPAGLIVDSNFDMSYLERNPGREQEITYSDIASKIPNATTVDDNGTARDENGNILKNVKIREITNFEFESQINDNKRIIVLPKKSYIPTFVSDIEKIMAYDIKSSETLSSNLKSVYNTRLTGS